MVVIAIIGILSAIAVPSYKTYVIRAGYAEMVSIMAGFKSYVVSTYDTTGSFPTSVWNTTQGASTNITGFKYAYQFHYNYNSVAAWWGFRLTGIDSEAHLYLCIKPDPTTSIVKITCGPWRGNANTDGIQVLKYLPSSCQGAPANDCAGV